MICTLCFTPFDECDSIGSSDALCQDCWESACSTEWWETLTAMSELMPAESTCVETVESGSSAP